MDMYKQLGMFRDHFISDNMPEITLKSQEKPKRLSTRQIIKKTLHLTRTKKKLLTDNGA